MKKFYLLIVFLTIFSGCKCLNPFRPTPPEYPTGRLPTPGEPTSPEKVISNLWYYYVNKELEEYMKCFTHPDDYPLNVENEVQRSINTHYQFTFIIKGWETIYEGLREWKYAEEENCARNMFLQVEEIELNLQNYKNIIIFDGETDNNIKTNKKEAKVLSVSYDICVRPKKETPQYGGGYIEFWLVNEGTDEKPSWKIYKWIDKETL